MGGYISPAAFSTAARGTFGNIARTLDMRGPGQANWDFSTIKNFPIYERVSFQFRSEFFNVFNHTNFGNPGNAVSSSSSFGVISTLAGNPRVIQFAGKILF